MTIYICLEGGEGTYKTTTSKALAEYYIRQGKRVLLTKEPGTEHLSLTMLLRKIMLSNEYADQLTPVAREFLSQAIRSIHIEKLIKPAIDNNLYDVIIQDRGIMSGDIYGQCCGHHIDDLTVLHCMVNPTFSVYYTHTFVFHNNKDDALESAKAKHEYAAGDAMESMGDEFHSRVNEMFYKEDGHCPTGRMFHLRVDDKTTDQIVDEIVKTVKLP